MDDKNIHALLFFAPQCPYAIVKVPAKLQMSPNLRNMLSFKIISELKYPL